MSKPWSKQTAQTAPATSGGAPLTPYFFNDGAFRRAGRVTGQYRPVTKGQLRWTGSFPSMLVIKVTRTFFFKSRDSGRRRSLLASPARCATRPGALAALTASSLSLRH